MRRCTYCFRFHPGSPTYCSHCGRSFDVRICSRGHRNPRGVQFCTECGSSDLSTPTPPGSFLHYVSGFVLYAFVALAVLLIVGSGVLALFYSLDWSALGPSLLRLVLVVAFLYWTTTLLPGPIRKVGRAAGKAVMKAVIKRHKE